MSNLLYSVQDIFGNDHLGYLKSHNKDYYNIPVYQRGYKWKGPVVEKLLTDIHAFVPEGSKFYCLQNITLVPAKDGEAFNVVDGQQRLTTLTVILAYLGNKDLIKGKVRFPEDSIRKETNKFLNEIICSDSVDTNYEEWDDFVYDYPDYDHQDVYYLFHAHQVIEDWFEKYNVDKQEFLKKLLTNVKLIVNNISDGNKEEKIFSNLNSKRVPLDGADLVRAILITRVANEEGKREADIKNIVRVNERRVRIGWELDSINYWWSKKDVSSYFKKFIKIQSAEISEGNKLFKDDRYPVNQLLLLFAEKNGEKDLSLEFIEERNNNAIGLYKELIKLHATLKDWFSDREIYHYLGYLFTHSNIKFKDVWEHWQAKTDTRKEFILYLKEQIRQIIAKDANNPSLVGDINWYENENESLLKILILLDVIWSVNSKGAFLPASAFSRTGHDIEHIFPQNPREIKDKKAYIQFINKYMSSKPNHKLVNEFDDKIDDPIFQKKIENFIKKFTGTIKINSIGNLVLLEASKNRSLGNNPYSRKRASLVEDINRGVFMRPHTLKVFIRFFDSGKPENQDSIHWTNADIDANAVAIETTLQTFLKD